MISPLGAWPPPWIRKLSPISGVITILDKFSPCPFLFCSMSQLFTLCPYLYVCSLPPTHMPIHQILRLTVISTIKLCFPDSKLYLCMCRVSCNDNLMSYQIIRLTVLSTIKLCFPDSKLYLCMCRVINFCQLLMWKAGHIRFYI